MATPNGKIPTTAEFFSSTPSKPSIPRLAISAEGLDKRGKTHWAIMTTPDPVAVVFNDPGTQNVIDKARREGRIVIDMRLEYEIPDPAIIAMRDVDKEEHAAWKKEWARFKLAMKAVIADTSIRTLVWDTGTELKALCDLNHYGKLRGNARIDVATELNADFSRVYWDLYNKRPDLNMVLIHKLAKEYKTGNDPRAPGNWTGFYERKGFRDMGFLVDLSLRFEWDRHQKDFYTELDGNQSTRFGTIFKNLDGSVTDLSTGKWYAKSPTDPSAFWNLAMAIFPETESTPEWWGL